MLVTHRIVSYVRSDRLLAGFTIGRVVLLPPMIALLISHDQVPAVALLGIFLVIDHFDGVIARRRGADGPARRTLDSATDHLAIWSVYAAMTAMSYAALPVVAILAIRDVYCAAQCRALLRERFVAIGADLPYKGLSALLAAWVAAAPVLSPTARTTALAFIALLAVAVALDLRRAIAQVSRMPVTTGSTVISAADLRAERPRWAWPVRVGDAGRVLVSGS